ncbi:hypothetical protein H1R20_g118, partial [Candolleomyces eurysporus]
MNIHDYKYSDCFKTITITYEGRSTQATVGDMFYPETTQAEHHHYDHQKDDDYIDSKLYNFNSEPHSLVNAGYLG